MDGKESRLDGVSKKSFQRNENSFSKIFKSFMILTIMMMANMGHSSIVPFVSAEEPIKYPGLNLEGIGWREQEL